VILILTKELDFKGEPFSYVENWEEIYEKMAMYPIRLQKAINQLIQDQKDLSKYINEFIIKIIPNTIGYSDEDSEVYSFHDDIVKWRLMCCYNGPTTEWIKNEDAINAGAFNSDAGYFVLNDKDKDVEIYHFKPGDIWLHSGNLRNKYNSFVHKAPREEFFAPSRLYTVGTPKFCA
jgi:hypothetical protein